MRFRLSHLSLSIYKLHSKLAIHSLETINHSSPASCSLSQHSLRKYFSPTDRVTHVEILSRSGERGGTLCCPQTPSSLCIFVVLQALHSLQRFLPAFSLYQRIFHGTRPLLPASLTVSGISVVPAQRACHIQHTLTPAGTFSPHALLLVA